MIAGPGMPSEAESASSRAIIRKAQDSVGHASRVSGFDEKARDAVLYGLGDSCVNRRNHRQSLCHRLKDGKWEAFLVAGVRVRHAVLDEKIG